MWCSSRRRGGGEGEVTRSCVNGDSSADLNIELSLIVAYFRPGVRSVGLTPVDL